MNESEVGASPVAAVIKKNEAVIEGEKPISSELIEVKINKDHNDEQSKSVSSVKTNIPP